MNPMGETPDLTGREKLEALVAVARYRPLFAAAIVIFGAGAATLEGVGLSFIYPIMEVAQAEGIMQTFAAAFDLFGLPFALEYLIIGISIVMTVRFAASFLMQWVKEILRRDYETHLRRDAFDATLDAEIRYFDAEGSDDILNSIITETRYAGDVIQQAVQALERFFLMGVYLAIMLYIGPLMTVYAVVLLGGITYLLRNVIEPGYTVGDRVASANRQIQASVQAGTQGIRDVKLFALGDALYDRFEGQLERYRRSSIDLERNKAALLNGYDLAAALALFAIIYVGFARSNLDLGALGIFLFAMFRMAPLASRVNNLIYSISCGSRGSWMSYVGMRRVGARVSPTVSARSDSRG
jgi:subfamily B ATP-binding cassette protein MsbA